MGMHPTASEPSRRPAMIAVLAVAVAAVFASIAGLDAQSPVLSGATPAIESFVRQALEDRLAAGDVPDLQLLRGAKVISIRREMPNSLQSLGPGALPKRDGLEFVLASSADLEATARLKGERQAYLFVDNAAIDGDAAKLWMGVDFFETMPAGAVKMCCCKAQGRFRLAAGRWRFEKWDAMTCS